jgi:hypothetical protein
MYSILYKFISVSNGASRFELWKYLVLLLDNRGRRGRDRIVW